MRVLIADDHPLIRSAMKLLLESDGHEVVAEADNGADAVQLARKHNVDLIILDITMPGLDGLEVINRIRASEVKSRILVVTSQSPLFYSQRSMKAGAAGFITKGQDLTELMRAVKVIMDGYTFFHFWRPAQCETVIQV